MELPLLLINTLLLRPYVFFFLAISLLSAKRLLGWKRTEAFFGITWLTAFLCEWLSTRTGFPFGDYYYTGSTVGQELYLSNIPFMDSLSFTFLLYASYGLALFFVLPATRSSKRVWWVLDPTVRTSWSVICLSCVFFVFIDIVIDPVALRGDRWFLGQIYGYPDPGLYFGVPIANFIGWAVVGSISLLGYRLIERRFWSTERCESQTVGGDLLLACGLYYLVLIFNLAVTVWIGEYLLGLIGCLIYLPISVLAFLKLSGHLPASVRSDSSQVNRG